MARSQVTQRIDLTGKRFGRWTVVHLAKDHGKYGTYWVCSCDCGTERPVPGPALRQGRSLSCGCLHNELAAKHATRHGEAAINRVSPEYATWTGMIKRCEDPYNISFEYYGARGVKVCERWRKDFTAFLADMGRKPSPEHSIDRYPDNAGDYEPGNCRWATKKEQAANRRKPRSKEMAINGLRHAPRGWTYYSVITPAVFRERLLPANTDDFTPEQRREIEGLSALAERHGTHIHLSSYRRG